MARIAKKSQDESTRERTYFSKEHLDGGFYHLASVWFVWRGEGKNQLTIGYKLASDGRRFKGGRAFSKWLDDKSEVFIKRELDHWKNQVNEHAGSFGLFYPEAYIRNKPDFFRWLIKEGAKGQTIEGYNTYLGHHVFPFFYQKMRLKTPDQWSSVYTEFDTFLEEGLPAAGSRNQARTALRRYVKFLEKSGAIPVGQRLIRNESNKRKTKEEVIPGELPFWNDVAEWIRTLPRGRGRWLIAICAAFGVRVGEALAVVAEDHLIGEDSVEALTKHNSVVKSLLDNGQVDALLRVVEAEKPEVSAEIAKYTGEVDKEPKSGPYIAACFSADLAILIAECIANGENKRDCDDYGYHQAYKYLKDQKALNPDYPFNEYTHHDFRRLHITLVALDLQSLFVTAQLHGQKSEETARHYYQWGHSRRLAKSKTAFRPIVKKS